MLRINLQIEFSFLFLDGYTLLKTWSQIKQIFQKSQTLNTPIAMIKELVAVFLTV